MPRRARRQNPARKTSAFFDVHDPQDAWRVTSGGGAVLCGHGTAAVLAVGDAEVTQCLKG